MGATIAWRLRDATSARDAALARDHRNVSWIFFVAYVVITGDAPTGVVAVDPLVWSLLEPFMAAASVGVFFLELRHTLRNRQPA